MATKEEIREGIAELCAKGMRECHYDCEACEELTGLLVRLDSQGVVLKVEREVPELSEDWITPGEQAV